MTTHNSYAFTLDPKGSIIEQLDYGIRGFELDIHDTWTQPEVVGRRRSIRKVFGGRYKGKFKIGHGWPGHEVYRKGGNPRGDNIEKWLENFVKWSKENTDHAPITIFIDIKKDLNDDNNTPSEQFGLVRLNQQILNVFKNDESRLVTCQKYTSYYDKQDSGPLIGDLRNKIIIVLMSFHGGTFEADKGERINIIKRIIQSILWWWKRLPKVPFFDFSGMLRTRIAYHKGRSQDNKTIDPICCVSFNPQDRDEPDFEESLEEKALFVTPYTPKKYADYIAQSREKGLVVRTDHKKPWETLLEGVNFPVTDHWKDEEYRNAAEWVV